jgi:hypothetical protein
MHSSSTAAGAATTIRRLPHVLLKVERRRDAMTALAHLVGGTDAVIDVDQVNFAVWTDYESLVGHRPFLLVF